MSKLAVISGGANRELTKKICRYLRIELSKAEIKRFPDGEIFVKVDENVRGKDVFVVQPTCFPPNENLMELLIIFDTLRRSSAQRITAVIPYYGYARQDRKDQPRVPITAKLVANLITSAGANRVLTLDLHASQIQGFFDIPLDNLYAANIFVDYFKKLKLKNVMAVSPDVGGIRLARAYARRMKSTLAIIDKRRISPTSSRVMNIIGKVAGKNVIIVDDLVSTGGTLLEAVNALKSAGAKDVYASVTHAILAKDALAKIKKSPLKSLIVTDTIPLSAKVAGSKVKVLTVASLLGEAIKRIHEEKSVSSLFS